MHRSHVVIEPDKNREMRSWTHHGMPPASQPSHPSVIDIVERGDDDDDDGDYLVYSYKVPT